MRRRRSSLLQTTRSSSGVGSATLSRARRRGRAGRRRAEPRRRSFRSRTRAELTRSRDRGGSRRRSSLSSRRTVRTTGRRRRRSRRSVERTCRNRSRRRRSRARGRRAGQPLLQRRTTAAPLHHALLQPRPAARHAARRRGRRQARSAGARSARSCRTTGTSRYTASVYHSHTATARLSLSASQCGMRGRARPSAASMACKRMSACCCGVLCLMQAMAATAK